MGTMDVDNAVRCVRRSERELGQRSGAVTLLGERGYRSGWATLVETNTFCMPKSCAVPLWHERHRARCRGPLTATQNTKAGLGGAGAVVHGCQAVILGMLGGVVKSSRREIGRYVLFGEIASGGMATVHLGGLLGPAGFSRTVAIKQLHPQFAKDADFTAMFSDEARLAARIVHPNVVPMLDVVSLEGELFLVMEYVEGEPLARLLRLADERGERIPVRITAAIASGMLHGLHAAHEAVSDRGEPLGIIHRDVSPHNVLVGSDGVPRLLDFGIAKAAGRLHTTREGQLKGKLPYMAPEQIRGTPSPLSDVYSAGVVLWETLAGRRLFKGDEAQVLAAVLGDVVEPPSRHAQEVTAALDQLVLRAVDREPSRRFSSAREMALALEASTALASASEVRVWLEQLAAPSLAERRRCVAEIQRATYDSALAPSQPAGARAESSVTGSPLRALIVLVAFALVTLTIVLLFLREPQSPQPLPTLALAPSIVPASAASASPAPAASLPAEAAPAARLSSAPIVRKGTRKPKNASAPVVPSGSRVDRVIDSRK